MRQTRAMLSPYTALLLLLLSSLLAPALAQEPRRAEWIPPAARSNQKTPFAPKPLGGDNIFSGDAESWLAKAIVEVEAGTLRPSDDAFVNDYVARLGRYLAAHSVAPSREYQFVVLDDEEVNAMSIGGGRIYVNLGMLKEVESEDELAGVIAHEIGHDAFGHAPKTVTRQLFWMTGVKRVKSYGEVVSALKNLLSAYEKNSFASVGENLLGFSRFNELEADRAAFYNTYKAGYNPRSLSTVLDRLERDLKKELGEDYAAQQFLTVLFGSHPPTSQRGTTLSWESNFVKMPKKEELYRSAAFDAMKARVAKM